MKKWFLTSAGVVGARSLSLKPMVASRDQTNGGSGIEHTPVLVDEVLFYLDPRLGGIYVDATVGLGGHARALVERLQGDVLILGLDRDAESLELARQRLAGFGDRVRLHRENFKNLPLLLNNLGYRELDGILVDLGVSAYQLLTPDRGFSFQEDAPLDMRMDRGQKRTAADLMNELSEEELADLLFQYGEERASRRIAREIVRERQRSPITRTGHLRRVVERATHPPMPWRIHPATRTFQALRIAVNDELQGLDEFILNAVGYLRTGGRLVMISFHSLEDRIIKQKFKLLSGLCICDLPALLCKCPRQKRVEVLTKKPVEASQEEIGRNPRSRSAKLRAVQKVPFGGPPVE